MTRHNGFVRRLVLLALVLSALVWAASARTAALQPDEAAMSAVGGGPCLLTDESDESRDADQQWRAQHHSIAVTESASGSKLAHAEFPTPFARIFTTSSAARAPARLVRVKPYYLRHTPLLI